MGGMKARVLVVDDDPALAEMLTIVLRGEGFGTAVVADGSRALPALRELKPDLVLLDLMLPGMNGIDVCKAIRAESGVPIVMLTAKSDTVDIVLGLESGADDYVVKPFKAEGAGSGGGGGDAPDGVRAGRVADDRRSRHRCPRARGDQGRQGHPAPPAGVRPAGGAGPQAASGVHP